MKCVLRRPELPSREMRSSHNFHNFHDFYCYKLVNEVSDLLSFLTHYQPFDGQPNCLRLCSISDLKPVLPLHSHHFPPVLMVLADLSRNINALARNITMEIAVPLQDTVD